MSRSVVSLFFGQSKERSISPFKMSEQRALWFHHQWFQYLRAAEDGEGNKKKLINF
jgi:hypothetical protein